MAEAKDLEELLVSAREPIVRRVERDAEELREPFREVLTCLAKDFANADLNVSVLFRTAGVRGNSARTRFCHHVGQRPSEYLEECRLELALRLMAADPGLTFGVISEHAGYLLESSFYCAFKRRFDTTAGVMRENLKAGKISVDEALGRHDSAPPFNAERSSTDPGRFSTVLDGNTLGSKFRVSQDEDSLFFREVITLVAQQDRACFETETLVSRFEFWTPALFRWLLKESREGCRGNRRRGLKLAQLAVLSLKRIETRWPPEELRILEIEGLINLGNACRLATEWARAENNFLLAGRRIQSAKGLPKELEANYFLHYGHLKTYRREFPTSTDFLRKAGLLYQDIRDSDGLALTKSALGYALWLADDLKGALKEYRAAKNHAEEAEGPKPYLLISIYSGLAECYASLEDLRSARVSLSIAASIADESEGRSPIYTLSWQEGLLEYSSGNIERSQRKLREAKTGFEQSGELCHAALISLDLCRLLLDGGLCEEAQKLVTVTLPIFQTLQLEEESLQALQLLTSVIDTGSLKEDMLSKIRALLEIQYRAPRWRPRMDSKVASGEGARVLPEVYPSGSTMGAADGAEILDAARGSRD